MSDDALRTQAAADPDLRGTDARHTQETTKCPARGHPTRGVHVSLLVPASRQHPNPLSDHVARTRHVRALAEWSADLADQSRTLVAGRRNGRQPVRVRRQPAEAECRRNDFHVAAGHTRLSRVEH